MLVYLDSKDLINLLNGLMLVHTEDSKAELRDGFHSLVVSFLTIIEIAGPLLTKGAHSNVMSLLARLEEMPLRFIHDARIDPLELREAVDAFSMGREPQTINPFVNRFDECIPVQGPPATRLYLRYSIAETVFDLWANDPGIFRNYRKYGKQLIEVLKTDRAMAKPPTLREHFIKKKIPNDLQLYGIPEPAVGGTPLAEWIYDEPTRCPGVRLGYEVYHQIRRNKVAKVRESDMVDLLRLPSLPYVDLMTMDGAMFTYTSQVNRSLVMGYESRIYRDLNTVFPKLCR